MIWNTQVRHVYSMVDIEWLEIMNDKNCFYRNSTTFWKEN